MKQAVNLGIYGADLSYASMFDQKQESMNHLAAAQKLAREMGVADALDEKIVERLNANQDSRDSLMKIVSEAYADLNGYLKEDARLEVAALVVSGGWIEALYLSTQYSGAGNSAIRQRIAEQKYSLTNLLEYFDKFGDNEKLREMKGDLLSLRDIYNEVTATAGKTEAKKEADGMVVIGNSSSMSISDETLKKIETKVKEIRSKYTA
jgi:DNA-directed RNA polymerase subunit F